MAELSFEERRALVERALNQTAPQGSYRSVRSTRDRDVVYEQVGSGTVIGSGAEEIYRVDYSILEGKVTLGTPEPVRRIETFQPVTFSSVMGGETVDDGEFVVRTGPIFRLGSYPDKGFSLNAQEADANVATLQPVPIDIEHDRSVFKRNPTGQFGTLERWWRKGEELIGQVKMPKAFHELLEPGEIPVSCHFDPSSKQLVRLALTGNPRITSARLSAMFSAAESRRSGDAMEPEDKDFLAKLKALFSGGTPNPNPSAPALQPGGDTAELRRLQTENETLRGEVTTLKGQVATFANAQVTTSGAAFADSIKDRLLPTERQDAIDSYTDALRTDNAGGVCFSEDGKPKEGAAVQRVRRLYESRKPHGLTGTAIVVTQGQAQPGQATQGAEFSAQDDPVDMAAVKAAVGGK